MHTQSDNKKHQRINNFKEANFLYEQKSTTNYSQKQKNSCRVNNKKDIQNKKIQTVKLDQKFIYIEDFVQNLNKKVVMAKLQVQYLSQQPAKINEKMSIFQQQNLILQLRKQNHQKNLTIQQLKKLIQTKDKEINFFKEKLLSIENKISKQNIPSNKLVKSSISSQYQINLNVSTSSIEEKLKNVPNSLQIDTDKINESFQQVSENEKLPNPQLSFNDPVFKIPCLSPTMLQMKCIEKMENERRKKFRQLRKNVACTNIISNEVQNLAAGINSPLNQQMLNYAQNPLKNRFIRKPTSPILSSMHSDSKANLYAPKINQIQASPVSAIQLEKEKNQPQKLNLPYFMSMKKKNKQNQK